MRVIHYLKDGTQVKDITGRVVKMEDAAPLYQMIRGINRKSNEQKNLNVSGDSTGSNK